MRHAYLKKFHSIDSATFAELVGQLGISTAACFRRNGESFVKVLRTGGTEEWSAAIDSYLNCTLSPDGLPAAPVGWYEAQELRKLCATLDYNWPNGTYLYFPEQELFREKFFYAVRFPGQVTVQTADLCGLLEIATARLRRWYEMQAERQTVTETGLREHIKTLGVDLTHIIDHELRTPLVSVVGYGALLKDMDPTQAPDQWTEYWEVFERETSNAIEAVQKLSLALQSGLTANEGQDTRTFDAVDAVEKIVAEARKKADEVMGDDQAKRLRLNFRSEVHSDREAEGSLRLFKTAVWEVIKNAMSHSKSGQVDIRLYQSGSNVVIDIADDGVGVTTGSEELIFLRFYQDPAALHARTGKRGLGLGLFLARHIVERHLGQLTLVRQQGETLFRFVWPRAQTQHRAGA